MSNKSSQEAKKLSVPRELADIQKEYQERVFAAGQLQYQISVLGKELTKVNGRMEAISNEAANRKKLDDLAKASEAASTVTTEEGAPSAEPEQV